MDKRTQTIIQKLLWDYDISTEEVVQVIQGEKQKCIHWDFEKLFIRMLEKLNWYDLLYLLGATRIKKELTIARIEKIHNPSLRNHYARLRKILHGETVPFTKWGPEFSEKVKDSLFSNRWYST